MIRPFGPVGPTRRLRALLLAIFAAIVAVLFHAPAGAHELRPAIIDATIDRSGVIELRLSLDLEAQIAGIRAEHAGTSQASTTQAGTAPLYDKLRAASADALRGAFAASAREFTSGLGVSFDGAIADLTYRDVEIPPPGDLSLARISTVIVAGRVPAGARAMTWTADPRLGDNVIRVTRAGEADPFFSTFLRAGAPSEPISLEGAVEQGAFSSLASYIAVGFSHIVPKGLDHILFVVGLFLLSPHLRPLMWQVSGFTLAHSVTLALGIYGVISVPAAIVEPLIAASIVFVAVENLFTDRLQRWRPAVVFGFGLLHGLGFAGVLSEFGLPKDQFVSALIGFNLGVELGQLAVISACFLGVGLWFRHRHWYRRAIAMPASVAVALVAAFWFVERIT